MKVLIPWQHFVELEKKSRHGNQIFYIEYLFGGLLISGLLCYSTLLVGWSVVAREKMVE